MGIFGDLIGGGSALTNDIFGSINTGVSNAVNYGQYARGEGELYDLRNRQMSGITGLSDAIPGQYGQLNASLSDAWRNNVQNPAMGRFDRLRDDSMRYGMGAREQAMGMLQGWGDQELSDINRQYDELGQSQQADLTSRGLSGTTVLPSLQQGLNRERSDSIGAAQQRIRGQKLSTFGEYTHPLLEGDRALGLAGAGAYSSLAGQGYGYDSANLYRQQGAQEEFGQLPLQYDNANTTALVNYFSRMNVNPGQGPLQNTSAWASNRYAPQPDYGSGSSGSGFTGSVGVGLPKIPGLPVDASVGYKF